MIEQRTYIHSYIHTHIHTYIHTYMPPSPQPCPCEPQWEEGKANLKRLGYSIGQVVYSNITYKQDGLEIVPGSRGTVKGPCNNSSLADPHERVSVKFDVGFDLNVLATNLATSSQVRPRCGMHSVS